LAPFRKTARQARPRGRGYPMGLGQDRKPVSDPLSSFYGASTSAGAPRFPFPLLNAQPSGGLSVTLPGGGVGKLRRPQILPWRRVGAADRRRAGLSRVLRVSGSNVGVGAAALQRRQAQPKFWHREGGRVLADQAALNATTLYRTLSPHRATLSCAAFRPCLSLCYWPISRGWRGGGSGTDGRDTQALSAKPLFRRWVASGSFEYC